ncbi:MAG: hypothetical protein KME49_00945 [Brasilonema octagenarum HA4186-MV1]|nr:hypothetical protein [Brasilonema octagenarum HA4186-MV1]
MIKKFTAIKSLLLLTSLGLGVTSYIGQAQAQQVAKMRFVWDFIAPSGAVYLNICSEPNFNINERTGGCAQIDILNSNVTKNQDRTRLVTDRLKLGQKYKACLVADNTFGNKQGRWIDCVDFTAIQGQTISFSIDRAKYVGAP